MTVFHFTASVLISWHRRADPGRRSSRPVWRGREIDRIFCAAIIASWSRLAMRPAFSPTRQSRTNSTPQRSVDRPRPWSARRGWPSRACCRDSNADDVAGINLRSDDRRVAEQGIDLSAHQRRKTFAGAVKREWVELDPGLVLEQLDARCVTEPTPAEPIVSLPGLAWRKR